MNALISALMIVTGLLAGFAFASPGNEARYLVPALIALMIAVLTRLNRFDR